MLRTHPSPPSPHPLQPAARARAAGGRRRRPRFAAAALAALVLACALPARAQTVSLALGVHGPQLAAGVAVHGARVQDTDVDLGVRVDDAVQLDLALRADAPFGPLGNVVAEAAGTLRTDGRAQGSVGARGVLGPVALGVHLEAFGGDRAVFDPLALGAEGRPALGAPGWGVRLDASGRPDRSLVVQASGGAYHTGAGWAGRAEARLRWLRAIGPHELSAALRAFRGPAAADRDAGAEVAFTLTRRRAPDLLFALGAGVSPDGVAPAGRVALAQRFAGGVDTRLELRLEPYRRDLAPYRLDAEVRVPLAPGTVALRAAGAAGDGAARAALQLRWEMPLELR